MFSKINIHWNFNEDFSLKRIKKRILAAATIKMRLKRPDVISLCWFYLVGNRQEYLHPERCGGRDPRQAHQEEPGLPAVPAAL